MIEIERRESVWVTTPEGVTLPGVVLWRRLGFVKVLYWDGDGEHHRVTRFLPSSDYLFPRAMKPWSASCGEMARSPRS